MCGGLFANIGYINIANHSFEDTSDAGQYGDYVYLAPATIDGWTYSGGAGLTGNNSGFTNGNANAPDGNQVLFLQDVSSASQSLSGFQSGVTYTLSFDLGFRYNYGVPGQGTPPQQVLQVSLGSTPLFGSGISYAYTPTYTVETVNFITSGPSTQTLTFAGTEPYAGYFDSTDFVDNVAISYVTPEPAFYGLLALGLGGLATVVNRRKKA